MAYDLDNEELEAVRALISKLPPEDLEKAVGGIGPHARNVLLAMGALAVVATTGVVISQKYGNSKSNLSNAKSIGWQGSYQGGYEDPEKEYGLQIRRPERRTPSNYTTDWRVSDGYFQGWRGTGNRTPKNQDREEQHSRGNEHEDEYNDEVKGYGESIDEKIERLQISRSIIERVGKKRLFKKSTYYESGWLGLKTKKDFFEYDGDKKIYLMSKLDKDKYGYVPAEDEMDHGVPCDELEDDM